MTRTVYVGRVSLDGKNWQDRLYQHADHKRSLQDLNDLKMWKLSIEGKYLLSTKKQILRDIFWYLICLR